ncbi:MAG: hypothetical protein RLO12_09665 [Fulvivirga sp.]|uniref:hypothetical protein n=1 Tax=Fulvivirga sp. TaxID=1931237 RepID=UPI0033046751
MKTKDILVIVTLLLMALLAALALHSKNLKLRLVKVENTLADVLDNSDQTKLALGYMIQNQLLEQTETSQKMTPIGFKYQEQNS